MRFNLHEGNAYLTGFFLNTRTCKNNIIDHFASRSIVPADAYRTDNGRRSFLPPDWNPSSESCTANDEGVRRGQVLNIEDVLLDVVAVSVVPAVWSTSDRHVVEDLNSNYQPRRLDGLQQKELS